jgi:hypothetical protein
MARLLGCRARPVKLSPELPDQFTLRPGETLVVLADHQDTVLVPALALDFFGRTPVAP